MRDKAINLFRQHKKKVYLMKISGFQVIVNFFTSILILRTVGIGDDLDVFYIALAIFAFLCTSINWSLESVLMPYLVDERGKNKEGSLFVSVIIMALPVSILMFISAPFWIEIIFVNYTATVITEDIVFIQRILIGAFMLESLTLVYNAMLQEKGKYINFAAVVLFANIVGLVFVYFTIDDYGFYVAALNQLIIKLVIFIMMSFMFLPKIHKNLSFDIQQLKLIFSRAKYILLGSIYYRSDEIAERYISSYLTSGFVSLSSFIQRVYGAITTVINAAIGFPTITVFANYLADKRYVEIKIIFTKYLLFLLLFGGAFFIAIAIFGEWFFLLIMGDSLTVDTVPLLPVSVLCLSFIVVARSMNQVSHSLILAMKKGSISTAYDSLAFTVNLLAKISLTIMFGIYGMLAAIIFSVCLTTAVKTFLAYRELGKLTDTPAKI